MLFELFSQAFGVKKSIIGVKKSIIGVKNNLILPFSQNILLFFFV